MSWCLLLKEVHFENHTMTKKVVMVKHLEILLKIVKCTFEENKHTRPITVSTYVLCFLYSCIYVFELTINKWVVQQLITENSEVSHSTWEPVTTAMTMKIELYKYLLRYHSAVFKFRQVVMSLSKKYFQISSILITAL